MKIDARYQLIGVIAIIIGILIIIYQPLLNILVGIFLIAYGILQVIK